MLYDRPPPPQLLGGWLCETPGGAPLVETFLMPRDAGTEASIPILPKPPGDSPEETAAARALPSHRSPTRRLAPLPPWLAPLPRLPCVEGVSPSLSLSL
jgi:hypothetical protein